MLVAKSSRRVSDRAGRRSVEPLSVVDRDEQLLLGAHGPEDVQQRDSHGMRIRRGAVLVVEDERAGERAPLCGDERVEHVCEDGIEKIAERGERQLGLALRRKRAQDPEPSFLGVGHAGRPERRLAHARVALEEERGCAVGDPGQEVPEGGALGVPPYHRSRHRVLIVRRARCRAYGAPGSSSSGLCHRIFWFLLCDEGDPARWQSGLISARASGSPPLQPSAPSSRCCAASPAGHRGWVTCDVREGRGGSWPRRVRNERAGLRATCGWPVSPARRV